MLDFMLTHLLFAALALASPNIDNPFSQTQKTWVLEKGKMVPIEGNWEDDDADLWRIGKPNSRMEHITKRGKEIVFHATYNIGPDRLRIIPVPGMKKRPNEAFFFGCSYVFGQGVNDNETLPYYFAKNAYSYRVISFAHPGYGTQQMTARLERSDFGASLVPKKGRRILLYGFPDFHIRRNIGAMELSIHYITGYAYYYLNSKDDLIRAGDFETGRPWLTWLYRMFWKSGIPERFQIAMPPYLRDSDYKLTAKLIEKAFRDFKEKYQGDEAYVIIYPGSLEENVGPMLNYFDKYGIKYLNYARLVPNIWDPQYTIPRDTHPTPRLNQIIARQLTKDLKL